MTTNLMDMLKLVESNLHKMEGHIELESFDQQVMKLWIEIYISKNEIKNDDHLRGKYEQVRNRIAQILQNQFDLALRQIEQADDEAAFSKAKGHATKWQGMFSNVDQSTVNSSPRLETAIHRYRLFDECFKKYTALTHRLSEESGTNISGLRTEVSSFLENLKKSILTLQSDMRPDKQEHDRRVDLFKQWIEVIENNQTVRSVFEVSTAQTYQVSGEYAAGMDDLKRQDPESTIYHYVSDDPNDPIMGWNKVRDVIVIWDRRWKRYCSMKIQQYAQALLNSGLNEKGPFIVDPFESKAGFNGLIEHIKRPIADLDDQTRREYQDINRRINQAISNFKPLWDRFTGVRGLISTINQRDSLDLLVKLDHVWAETGEQIPLYAKDYKDSRDFLIVLVKNQLQQWYSSYKKLFLSTPSAVKRAAQDVVPKLEQFTEFEADRFDLERLIKLSERFESEMRAASGELPDVALARLEALQVTIENEMGDVPSILTEEIQTRRAGLKPIKVGQELIARATDLLKNIENRAANLPLEQLAAIYLNQIESVLKQMVVALPELSKQTPTSSALQPIYDSLVNSQGALLAWSDYLKAGVEIKRPGADLKQINDWLDVVRNSVYRKDLFIKLDDIASSLARMGPNDSRVAAIVAQINTTLDNSDDDYQNLPQGAVSGLMSLWAKLNAVQDLSTTRTGERRAARAALEQKIPRIAMSLLPLLHDEVTKISREDLELIVRWMQENKATDPYLNEMEAYLYVVQAVSYLNPERGEPNLDAAITAWKRARERNHPHAEAMQRALKKMKALVDVEKGVYISLTIANADPTLRYDTGVIACTLQSKLLKIIEEYENINYLSGKVKTVVIVGEAKVVPFPLIEDFRTEYGNITFGNGDVESSSLDLQYQEMWDKYHLSDVLQRMNIPVPPDPALIYDEFLFRSQTYKNLASLISRMAQSETLVQLQHICSQDAPSLVDNVDLNTTYAETVRRLPELANLAVNLWRRGKSAYEEGLVASIDPLVDPNRNDYRRMILNPDSICSPDGKINRIHELQIRLARSIDHFQRKKGVLISTTYQGGTSPDSIGRHVDDLSSIWKQAKDLHDILTKSLTLYFARLQLDDTAWINHPLGKIFTDLTNFIQDVDLNTYLAYLEDLDSLYQDVCAKQESGLLLALGKEGDDELDLLNNHISVIKGRESVTGYADITSHPTFTEINKQVQTCCQKRKRIQDLLDLLKEAGNVAGVPGATTPTQNEADRFAASKCSDPLEWASSLLRSLEKEVPDPLQSPLWRWNLSYGNMTEESVIENYIALEKKLVTETKAYIEILNARVGVELGMGKGDLTDRINRKTLTNWEAIQVWLLQANYEEAYDEWLNQVGLKFEVPEGCMPVNGGGEELASQFKDWSDPVVNWLNDLGNRTDIREAVYGIDRASKLIPYVPVDGVCITGKMPGGIALFTLYSDMVKLKDEFEVSLNHNQSPTTYRTNLLEQERVIFNTLSLWTRRTAYDLSQIASFYEDYEEALVNVWDAWNFKSKIRVPWWDFWHQYQKRLDEANKNLQPKACKACRLAPKNVTLREQLGLTCSLITNPQTDNSCGLFKSTERLQ